MREILFRGQTRKYGEKVRMGDGQKLPGHWVYGGVLQGAGSHSIIYGSENVNDPGENLDKWCVHTDTLGQFVGLTDKNGNKIFEGDVMEFEAYGILYRGVVTIDGGNTGVFCKGGSPFLDDTIKRHDAVKIGNIYDNPELFENP